MLTKADIRERVLERLAVADANQTTSAADAQLVEQAYDDEYYRLASRGMVSWPNTGANVEEIPEKVSGAMVAIVTPVVAPAFGLDALGEPLLALKIRAERDLVRAINNDYVPGPVPAEYF